MCRSPLHLTCEGGKKAPIDQPQIASPTRTHTTPSLWHHRQTYALSKKFCQSTTATVSKNCGQPTRSRVCSGPSSSRAKQALIAPQASSAAANVRPRPDHEEGVPAARERGSSLTDILPPSPSSPLSLTGRTPDSTAGYFWLATCWLAGCRKVKNAGLATSEHGKASRDKRRFEDETIVGTADGPSPSRRGWAAGGWHAAVIDSTRSVGAWGLGPICRVLPHRLTPPAGRRRHQPQTTRLRNLHAGSPKACPNDLPLPPSLYPSPRSRPSSRSEVTLTADTHPKPPTCPAIAST